jgi:Zn-dependent protease with chaperone function
MAETMNFFRAQDEARGRTTKLVVLLWGAVILVAVSPFVVGMAVGVFSEDVPEFFLCTTITMLITMLSGSLSARAKLAEGGSATACQLGAKLVSAQRPTQAGKVFLNVVQEMALAASLPVPSCYVFSDAPGINAFAAGNHPKDAAIALTQGALTHLNREELQGVVAYAMSHIANSDMKLCNRFIGVAGGLNAVGKLGMGVIVGAGAIALGGPAAALRAAAKDIGMLPMIPIMICLALVGAFLLLLVGLFLLLLGGIGLGLTYALRAAVWNQRESLGDASAVQFTRYPAGLASALKKVAEFGSEIESTKRLGPEWDVLFFASSRGDNENLTDRIKLIDPNFDGVLTRYTEVQREAFTKAADADTAKASAATDKQLQAIFSFGGTLPPELRTAASEPVGAMGIVLGLILRQDATLREQQLKQAEGLAGGEVVKEARKLAGALRALPPGQRMPLLDVAMPALRQLSTAQVSEFSAAIDQVGGKAADGLMILLIHASMRRYLSAVPRRADLWRGSLASSCARVLAAVVQSSSEGPEAQAAAYLRGNQILGLKQVGLGTLPVAPVNLEDVENALGIIAHPSTPEGWGQKLVNACCVAMLNDGKAEPAEVEMVRAVADTLGIVLTRSGTQHPPPIYATL